MPFVSNMNEEEKKDPSLVPQGAVAPTGAGGSAVHLAPSSSVPTAGGGSAAGGNVPAGGQFASLNQYLAANQNQAEPLAGKLTAGIGQQYNNLQNQNESTLGTIGNQVAAGGAPANASDVLAKEAANPVSFTSNPNNVSTFKNLLNASYAGPASAESTNEFTNQQTAINNAISTGQNATKTEAGRENLLSQNEARPTSGVTALNSAILSQNPNALNSVEKAYEPFNNLLGGLSSGAADINKQIAANQTATTKANQTANAQLAGQTNQFTSGVNQNLTQAQNAVNAYNAGVNDYTTNVGQLQPVIGAVRSSGLLNALGIADPYSQNYSLMGAPTANTIATPDQLSTEQALNTLGGQNLSLINPNAAVGGYTAPGAVPVPANFQSLLDQLALADITKNYAPSNGATPIAINGSPVQASDFLSIGAPNQFNNYSSQVQPFVNLLGQLNQLTGNQYVKPITYLGKPIPGRYSLVS